MIFTSDKACNDFVSVSLSYYVYSPSPFGGSCPTPCVVFSSYAPGPSGVIITLFLLKKKMSGPKMYSV